MTANEVFAFIKSISAKYYSGKPPIFIDSLAQDLNINKSELTPILANLKKLDLITLSTDIISLTDTGKNTALIVE